MKSKEYYITEKRKEQYKLFAEAVAKEIEQEILEGSDKGVFYNSSNTYK